LTSLDCLDIPVTASLGSIKDTLNYNGDFTDVNDFPVDDSDVGKLRTIAQEALRYGGLNVGFLEFEPSDQV
jgi:hypothetical protein